MLESWMTEKQLSSYLREFLPHSEPEAPRSSAGRGCHSYLVMSAMTNERFSGTEILSGVATRFLAQGLTVRGALHVDLQWTNCGETRTGLHVSGRTLSARGNWQLLP